MDDEYANMNGRDPKILLTTSRDPSTPLKQFVKHLYSYCMEKQLLIGSHLQELNTVFPNSQRINRGAQVISEIVETCREHNFTDLILVHENRGVPDRIVISHLPFGPTAYFHILNVVSDSSFLCTLSTSYDW
ncbi:Anticodon-binding [Artemisia annua]|uniref:Anticodon-binding n=1 Tax=Artemisia annua TaxID=35608 RepID=A0A2U1K9R1_ARTAN|nr:Anticodon-binding [Artemisia annua]